MHYLLCPRCQFKMQVKKHMCPTCGFELPTEEKSPELDKNVLQSKSSVWAKVLGYSQKRDGTQEKPALS